MRLNSETMKKNWQKVLLGTAAFLLLVYLLYWHFRLGIMRYFDVDEFAHLHWGYNFFIGKKPYTDFFYIFPPFFLYPIAFIFSIFGRSIAALVQARVFIFAVFLGQTGLVFLIGKKLQGVWVGLLSAIIFAFLPLPFDKMLEVRPDLPAAFLAFLGLYFFILGGEKKKKRYFFWSGICYAASLGFVPKTLFFLVPPLLVMGYRLFYKPCKFKNLQGEGDKGKVFSFLAGGVVPAVVCLLLILSFGDFRFAIYSITKLVSDATKVLASKFYMRPDIFFYPNQTYYGLGGYSRPYIFNLVIYVSAALWAIVRFVSFLSYKDSKKCMREFLVVSSFWINLAAFVKFYPLKHAQYFIMFVPFIAFYFADLLEGILERTGLSRGKARPFRLIIYLVFLLSIFFVSKEMNEKKVQWTNKDKLEKINKLLVTIPKDSAVFDLTGAAVFFPDGYYLCCLPYGQYQEAFVFNLPNLEKDLKKRGTKYVHTDSFGRLDVLPPMQARYIKENFKSYFPDGSVLVRK